MLLLSIHLLLFGIPVFVMWIVVPFARTQFATLRDGQMPSLMPPEPSVIPGFDRDFTPIFGMILFVGIVGGAILLRFAIRELRGWDERLQKPLAASNDTDTQSPPAPR